MLPAVSWIDSFSNVRAPCTCRRYSRPFRSSATPTPTWAPRAVSPRPDTRMRRIFFPERWERGAFVSWLSRETIYQPAVRSKHYRTLDNFSRPKDRFCWWNCSRPMGGGRCASASLSWANSPGIHGCKSPPVICGRSHIRSRSERGASPVDAPRMRVFRLCTPSGARLPLSDGAPACHSPPEAHRVPPGPRWR